MNIPTLQESLRWAFQHLIPARHVREELSNVWRREETGVMATTHLVEFSWRRRQQNDAENSFFGGRGRKDLRKASQLRELGPKGENGVSEADWRGEDETRVSAGR